MKYADKWKVKKCAACGKGFPARRTSIVMNCSVPCASESRRKNRGKV